MSERPKIDLSQPFSMSLLHQCVQELTYGNERPCLILMSPSGYGTLWARLQPSQRGRQLEFMADGIKVSVAQTDQSFFDGVRVILVPDLPADFLVLPSAERLYNEGLAPLR